MDREFPWFETVTVSLVVLAIVFAVFNVFAGLFVDQSIAIRALENQGFTNVKIVDKQWFAVSMRGCGNDVAKFLARAVNPAHDEVELFVCVGWPFKGATVRSN